MKTDTKDFLSRYEAEGWRLVVDLTVNGLRLIGFRQADEPQEPAESEPNTLSVRVAERIGIEESLE